NTSVGYQLLQPGQRYSTRRLAANALGADLRLRQRDLALAHLLHPSAGLGENLRRLLPARRVANPNRARPRVCRHRHQLALAATLHPAVQRVRALGLDHADLWNALYKAQVLHLRKAL